MQKNTVCLTMEDAKQIYELFNACGVGGFALSYLSERAFSPSCMQRV